MVGACYLKSSSREIVSSVGPSGPQACVPHSEDTTAAVQKLLSIRPAPTPLTEALTLICGSISKAHMAQVRFHFLSCHFLLGKSWGCPNSMSFLASLGWSGTIIHPQGGCTAKRRCPAPSRHPRASPVLPSCPEKAGVPGCCPGSGSSLLLGGGHCLLALGGPHPPLSSPVVINASVPEPTPRVRSRPSDSAPVSHRRSRL